MCSGQTATKNQMTIFLHSLAIHNILLRKSYLEHLELASISILYNQLTKEPISGYLYYTFFNLNNIFSPFYYYFTPFYLRPHYLTIHSNNYLFELSLSLSLLLLLSFAFFLLWQLLLFLILLLLFLLLF